MTSGAPNARSPRPPAHIVEAITRMNIGGPARHVIDVANGLSEHFDFTVAAGVAPPSEGEIPTGPLTVERLPLVRSVSPHLDAQAVARMRSLFRRRRVDLVHSHMAKAGLVARVAASSLRSRPATVHTFHGHVLSGYFPRRAERAFVRIERNLARRTDLLLTVSPEIRDELLDLGIGRQGQYEVVQIGTDLSSFADVGSRAGRLRDHLGLDQTVPLIAVPARLAPIKDHRTLFSAMARVPHVHLAVLGDGDLMAELVALATELQLVSRVHFVGWWQDMPGAFADVDLVVLTSRNEGTPLSLIEAGAAGVATVATAVGGVPAVVIDGRTGVLVPPGDAAGVSSAIRRLIEDVPARRTMGQRARQHVREQFGLERSLQQVRAVYESLT